MSQPTTNPQGLLVLTLALALGLAVDSGAIRIEPGLGAYQSVQAPLHVVQLQHQPQYQPQYQPHHRQQQPQQRQHQKEQQQDLSKVPGVPGHDYPVYHSVPDTSFSCEHVPFRPGMYANVETHCQAYHVCHDGREGKQGSKFLCTNGTLFNQEKFTCDWWYNVNCNEALQHYNLNLDPLKNPYFQKPKEEKVYAQEQGHLADAHLPHYAH